MKNIFYILIIRDDGGGFHGIFLEKGLNSSTEKADFDEKCQKVCLN